MQLRLPGIHKKCFYLLNHIIDFLSTTPVRLSFLLFRALILKNIENVFHFFQPCRQQERKHFYFTRNQQLSFEVLPLIYPHSLLSDFKTLPFRSQGVPISMTLIMCPWWYLVVTGISLLGCCYRWSIFTDHFPWSPTFHSNPLTLLKRNQCYRLEK